METNHQRFESSISNLIHVECECTNLTYNKKLVIQDWWYNSLIQRTLWRHRHMKKLNLD